MRIPLAHAGLHLAPPSFLPRRAPVHASTRLLLPQTPELWTPDEVERMLAHVGDGHPDVKALGGDAFLGWLRYATSEKGYRSTAELGTAEAWAYTIRAVHTPQEKRIQRRAQAALDAQAKRLARKVPRLMSALREHAKSYPMINRAAVDDLVEGIVGLDAEIRRIANTLRASVKAALLAGLRNAGANLPGDVTYSTDQVDKLVEARLGEKLGPSVAQTSIDATRRVVIQGLRSGASVSEIQATLQRHPRFNARRALTIARTETLHAVEAGAQVAYKEAAKAGVKFKIEFLSSRDDVVRETHADADGQRVDVGEDFKLSDGDSGPGPGLFQRVENVVNCRCTTRAVQVRT